MTASHLLSLIRAALERSFVRYLVTGAAATLVYFLGGLFFVRLLGWPLLPGNACAFILGFIVSYAGQRFWTFRQARGRHAELLPRFALTQAAGLAANSLLVGLLDMAGCPYEASMIAASALVPLLTYALLRFWVFRHTEQQTPRPYGGLPGFVPKPGPLPPLSPDRAPRVSVIMNCLDSARDLEEALDSLAAQTFTDFEVVFWDNGSTDKSPLMAQGHAALHGRLRYFRGSETVPLGAARNLAIREARGELIAFLDCDDLWRPKKLARQVPLFDDPDVGLVCTDTEMFDGRRVLQRVFANSAPGRGRVFGDLLRRQWISMSSAVLRRAALDAVAENGPDGRPRWFDENLNVCEEADVFYRVAHDWKLDYVDEPLTIWRVHGGNTTFRKFGQFADETLRILDKHRALYPGYDAEHPDLVLLLRQRAAFQKAVSLWREGKGAQARDVLRPWRDSSRKHRLFWLASYLPGVCFDAAARVYFAVPRLLRR